MNLYRFKNTLYLLLFAFFSYKLLLITLQYIPIRLDVAFLNIKQQYIDIIPWRIAFFVHVFSSMFVLFAGFTQFSSTVLRKYPRLHRWIGKIYIFDVLFITGPASFVMALFANGGISSRIAFTTLAVLWIFTTYQAYSSIKARNIKAHKAYMIRSFALTLSAITLRAWKYALVFFFALRPMDVYMLVAWLGFVPNLLVAEWLIRKPFEGKKPLEG